MAPKKSTETSAGPGKTDRSHSDSQDASQDSGHAVSQMAKTFGDQIKKKTAERRQAKTPTIQAAHEHRVGKLRADMKVCFDSHETELRALRRPDVERLIELLQRKRELETSIDKCQADLARSFDEAAQQLQASIYGRVEDLFT